MSCVHKTLRDRLWDQVWTLMKPQGLVLPTWL
jgi:hypothetical protein